MFKYRQLFFIPSFYLLVTFSVAYLLYWTGIVKWEQPPFELHFWCWLTILMSLFSVISSSKRYNKLINDDEFKKSTESVSFLNSKTKWLILLSITALGVLGIVKYVLDYSNYLGAFGIFYSIFTEDAGQLRSMAENVESLGTQLSYFSWISAFIITIDISSRKVSKWWLFFVFIIIILNSIFLDRTRPVWLIFTCALCYFLVRYHLYLRRTIIYVTVGIITFFLSIFIAIGSLLGKVAGDDNYITVDLPSWTQPVFLYLTSSFAYLGRLFYYDNPVSYDPERVTYPLQKILAKAQLVNEPPSQILEFYSVPMLTNVGSFLEPFLQDGGRLFLFIGILIHTILFDWLSFKLMKRISVYSIISIATLCFVNFIAFFVPKITSTATWFVLFFSLLLLLMEKYLIGKSRLPNP
jgi:oligosaccharide repeat unit polymerase